MSELLVARVRIEGMHDGDDAPTFFLRKALDAFPPYLPGKPAREVPGLTAYKLASNEQAAPPLPEVLDAIAEAGREPRFYPDTFGTVLIGELSRLLDRPRDWFILGTGSSELINAIVQATCDDGDEAIYPWPSFEMYPQVTGMAAARRLEIPLTADARLDLPAMAAAFSERTRLVFLCSPNNPTGPALRHAELEEFMRQVPAGVIVVLDEAYLEYVTVPDAADGLELQRRWPNLVLLRTFSKAHGLAGMRIGYAVAHPRVIEALTKTVMPFGVSAAAQMAALASLRCADAVRTRAAALSARRDQIAQELRDLGYRVPEAQGNFVWLPLAEHSGAFEDYCADHALSVRNLDDGVRVTIGEEPGLQRFLGLAREFRGRIPEGHPALADVVVPGRA
jgi:histidinol-phosphate aminotransferase